jgi:hypothetical protein
LWFRLVGLGLLAQLRHPGVQLGQRHQLFLVGSNQVLELLFQPSLLAPQLILSFAERIGVAGCRSPSFDFCLDKRRIFQQAQELAPNEFI